MTEASLKESLTAAFDAAESDAGTSDSAIQATESAAPASFEQPTETKAERARDESGRFVAKPDEPAEPANRAEAAPAVERKPRPKSWRKEFDSDWEKLDPRVADYLHEREEQYTNGVTTYKQEWDRVRPLLDSLSPFQSKFKQYNAQPEYIVPALLNAHLTFLEGSPQQKQMLLQQLARDYGIPYGNATEGEQQASPVDANTQWLMQQLQQTQAGVQNLRQAWDQREQAALLSEIQHMASQADQFPHFEAVRNTMADLMEAGKADSLAAAYKKAIRLHDDIWEQETEKQFADRRAKEQADKQAAVAKAKAAAVSPKTSSPTGTVAKDSKGDLKSQLSANFDAVVGGRI